MPFPTPEALPDPGIEPTSLASTALAGGFFTNAPPGKHAPFIQMFNYKLMGAFENTCVHLSRQGYNELKSSRQGLLPIPLGSYYQNHQAQRLTALRIVRVVGPK